MMRGIPRLLMLAGLALGMTACAPQSQPVASVSVSERDGIEARLMQDIRTLASDEFGGRRPGTEGERLTTDYIAEQLRSAGLESGTNDPSSPWFADVPLVSTQPSTSRVVFTDARGLGAFEMSEASAVVFTSGRRNLVERGDVVFVGKLGKEVPDELVAGKVIVMVGEAGASPARRAQLFEKAPAAILTVIGSEEEIANIRTAFGRERIQLSNEEPAQLSGYVTSGAMAAKLGKGAWESLLAEADDPAFEPWEMAFKVTVEAITTRREFDSKNVIGKLPGTVPGSGAVLLLGHWDHLGECGTEADADRICNGAVDNASGIAVMLELSRRLAASGSLERDVYVLATSAEESGLLGARAFIENPAIPLDSIVAAFNFDTIAVAPAGSKVGFVGEGETTLDTLVRETVAEAGRELGDKEFANSFLRRQDGWALLQEGVPAVMLSSAFSSQIVLGPFLSADYHRSSDEIERIELGGAIDDLLLHEALVRRTANTALFPTSGG